MRHATLRLVERVFVGSEALARGALTRHELRTSYRRVLPDVYAAKRAVLTLEDRTTAAWLWSGREGVVTGLAASAVLGARWVDRDVPIELNWANHRSPDGVVTRNDTLLDREVVSHEAMAITSAERTAFDLARRGPVAQAVARLDALARATQLEVDDDGKHHTDRSVYTRDIIRLEYLNSIGWIIVRVVAEHRRAQIVHRVRQARELRRH